MAATDGLSQREQHPLLSGEDRPRRHGGEWGQVVIGEGGTRKSLCSSLPSSLPTPNPFTPAAASGMFLDAPRAVVPRNQAASFLYSDPPMRQIKTRTAPRRSWIIPSRAPSQPRSMGRCRRIVFRHPGPAAVAGRLRRESRSPRRRLLDR